MVTTTDNVLEDQFSKRYQEIVRKAGLAEHSAVKGCMVIKPYGYAIWEKIQAVLDDKFKKTGHQNAYFPLFIPKSFLSAEATHVEGFAKECAVVTHYRLKSNPDGPGVVVDPEAKLEEELIVRPTSETIIWNSFRGWIQSYRDLPLLINQWANVVRWEMRTRLFLRTTEFLWQEGHTAHATPEDAMEETKKMLDVYEDFAQNYLAIPVIKGIKTANERFAGALETFCIEGMMKDGKAIQMGTSHFLGQNFAKAFDVKFADRNGKMDWVWATSWGVSTRLIGSLIMAHADEKGMVLPPRIAPVQLVIIPICSNNDQLTVIKTWLKPVLDGLDARGISYKMDCREKMIPKEKYAEYELMGIPLRVSAGEKELNEGVVEICRRDTSEKTTIPVTVFPDRVQELLDDIQHSIYNKALAFRKENTRVATSFAAFREIIENDGGFIMAHWDGTSETEAAIKEATRATIRCIPLEPDEEPGICIYSGKPSSRKVLFAKAY